MTEKEGFVIQYVDSNGVGTIKDIDLSCGEIFIEKTHGKETADLIDKAWENMFST